MKPCIKEVPAHNKLGMGHGVRAFAVQIDGRRVHFEVDDDRNLPRQYSGYTFRKLGKLIEMATKTPGFLGGVFFG